ncbi:MAG: GNAT family N-acetyltransferase [Planctomycetes bacterium]|nr:GNAT family N-acetyltransferase [Planctomycetota bacterium]
MTFQLKDGRTCTIRECVEADAEPVLKLFRTVAAESDNLGRLPDEIKLTIEEEREYVRARRESPNSIMVLIEVDGRPVALAGVEGPKLKKFAHHGEVGMSVLREYWRLGIGRAILDYLEAWARQAGLRKLCLRVYDFNEPAYRLYCGAGFTEEGRLKADVLRADGTYGDTIYLAKHFV